MVRSAGSLASPHLPWRPARSVRPAAPRGSDGSLASGLRRGEDRTGEDAVSLPWHGVEPRTAPPPDHADHPNRVVVRSSLRGLAAGAATPLLLLSIGGAALADGGLQPFPALLVVLGLGIGIVVLGDLPRRVEIDAVGLTRVCPLRRHRLPWDRLVAIERGPASSSARARNVVARREGRTPTVSGGLVARGRRKRRWLLTDHVESRAEYDALAALLADLAVPVHLRAPRPHDTAPPSDLYRRRRHGR